MDLQRISIKILTDAPVTLNLDPFLSIFGRWRRNGWVDLADYAHMQRGPGIVLIGNQRNFSFDLGTAAPGFLYASKKGLSGSPEDRLKAVFQACLALTRDLLAESEFPPGVHAQTGSLELAFNDRLETPNNEATDSELRPAISAVLDRLFGAGAYRLTSETDPGRRYGFSVRSEGSPRVETLLAHLES